MNKQNSFNYIWPTLFGSFFNPEHKKIMNKWVSISVQRHLEFENIVEALDRHKLDLNNLSPSKSLTSENSSSDIADQINKLNTTNPDDCFNKFKSNNFLGLLVLLNILIGKII